jgi:chorismate-pyruvate lyase
MSNSAITSTPGVPVAAIDPYRVRPLPSPASPPDPLKPWILLTGSMTRAIGDALGELPVVQPGFEGPTSLAPWERRLLGISESEGYAREVVLTVRGDAVLSARTVSRLHDPALEVIRRLGSRPLAQLLFDDPRWVRGSAPIPLIELSQRRAGRTCVWQATRLDGRRAESRILVSEFFEPGLLSLTPAD